MKKSVLFLLGTILLCENDSWSQSIESAFHKLSRPEKHWVYAHPFVARKAYLTTKNVLNISLKEMSDSLLDGKTNGGQVDAFRHGYWMAMLSEAINPRKALALGKAHEAGNKLDFLNNRNEDGERPDSVSSVMDLFNNLQGIEVRKHHPDANPEAMKELIIKSILEGTFRIIKTNQAGQFLDCSGQALDLQIWKGRWDIPKCLISSSSSP